MILPYLNSLPGVQRFNARDKGAGHGRAHAGGGLLINIIVAWMLHASAGESLNVEGAFWHVIADLLGSVIVIVSSILIIAFEWYVADPVLSVAIGVLILISSWGLVTKIIHVLIEGTPRGLDVFKLRDEIEEVEGVTPIHDVHAWTITSGYDAFSAHILLDPEYGGSVERLLRRLRRIVKVDYGIGHVTLQVEQTL